MRIILTVTFFLTSLAFAAGKPAPDFSLKNQDGKEIKLSALRGKTVLIYFYPKDGTPGCTKESCVLRDHFKKFQAHGAVIFGVSTQDEKSHQEFIKQHKLPFDLLVDADGKVAAKYGVGSTLGYLERKSVLIAPDGTIVKRYETVDPTTHAITVLADIDSIAKKN